MKKLLIFLCITFLFISNCASQCFGYSMTITDGDFMNWSFTDWTEPENSGSATVSRLTAGGNPDYCLEVTTYTPSQPYTTAYGIAVNNDFIWDPAIQGAITNVSMNIDVKSISAWGQGQDVLLVALQSGNYYCQSAVSHSGSSSIWHTLSSDLLSEEEFVLFRHDPTLPDFSENGDPIRFGFAAGNSISGTYTQYYDNWEITMNYDTPKPIPEPANMLLLGSGLIGLAGVRRKFIKL